MSTPLELQDCLDLLNPIFHQEFKEFYHTVTEGEEVFAVADCSARGFAENATGGYLGFLALTARRIALVIFKANRRRSTARYYQAGEGFFYQIVTDPAVLGEPAEPLDQNELASRTIQEASLAMLIDVEIKSHFGTVEDQAFRALELEVKGSGRGPDGWLGSLGVWRVLLDETEGRAIYMLLKEVIQNGTGSIQTTISRDELLLRLERLASLFQQGMLTEEEFKAGKARLLGL